jgi:hypothetical protein
VLRLYVQFEKTLGLHVATKLHTSALGMEGIRNSKGLKKEKTHMLQAKLKQKAKEKSKDAAKAAVAAQMKKKGGLLPPFLLKLLGKNNKVSAMVDEQIDSQIDSQIDQAMPGAPTAPPAAGATADDKGDEGGGDVEVCDDLVSQLTVEQYVASRVRPVTAWFEARAALMAKRSQQLEQIGLLMNSAGAVLAILEYGEFISITVSLASTAMAIGDYFYVPPQITTTNKAMQDCHNLINWWDSLSLVQRKARKTKKKLADALEQSILDVVQSRTMVSSALPGAEEEDEEA